MTDETGSDRYMPKNIERREAFRMTIQECYEMMGGAYAQVAARLPSARLIERFIVKFLDDDSYSKLCSAMQDGNREEAFRAAHTLKGVCGNLSIAKLYDAASALTELLRPETDAMPEGAQALMEHVEQRYEQAAKVIRAYAEGK